MLAESARRADRASANRAIDVAPKSSWINVEVELGLH